MQANCYIILKEYCKKSFIVYLFRMIVEFLNHYHNFIPIYKSLLFVCLFVCFIVSNPYSIAMVIYKSSRNQI